MEKSDLSIIPILLLLGIVGGWMAIGNPSIVIIDASTWCWAFIGGLVGNILVGIWLLNHHFASTRSGLYFRLCDRIHKVVHIGHEYQRAIWCELWFFGNIRQGLTFDNMRADEKKRQKWLLITEKYLDKIELLLCEIQNFYLEIRSENPKFYFIPLLKHSDKWMNAGNVVSRVECLRDHLQRIKNGLMYPPYANRIEQEMCDRHNFDVNVDYFDKVLEDIKTLTIKYRFEDRDTKFGWWNLSHHRNAVKRNKDIAEIAYGLWEKENRPDNMSDMFWKNAELAYNEEWKKSAIQESEEMLKREI